MKTQAKFEIQYHQYLDAASKPSNDLPEWAKDNKLLIKLYKDMLTLRMMDKKAIAMQRTGKMRTYPSVYGQEAVGVGAGSCLTKEDVLVPYYRGQGSMVGHGIKLHEILLYWGGDERGSDYQDPMAKEDFPIAVPIATQILHAAGVATAIKLRGQKGRAVFTEIGEGGTSEGEFYEGLNVAGVWQLPMVTVINNNQWAISVPSELQTNCETYAQKAIAAGIEGIQVDGNDIIAVRDVVGNALEKARKGGGPTVIEAITYRLGDHTTADDASRYNDKDVHNDALKKEPVERLAKYLLNLGALAEKDMDKIEAECKAVVDKEVELYLDKIENDPQSISSMFDYLFAELPEKTKWQVADAEKWGGAK